MNHYIAKYCPWLSFLCLHVVMLLFFTGIASAGQSDAVQKRISNDVRAGKAIVIHVIVALADNKYQQIVPVPARIGNGQDPKHNLYWGAMYGVSSYFARHRDWKKLRFDKKMSGAHVLDRVLFYRKLQRHGKPVHVYLFAEAWDGKMIYKAINTFYDTLAGKRPITVRLQEKNARHKTLAAGSQAHIVSYIGHNGLMDITFAKKPSPGKLVSNRAAKSAMVLACKSKPYFRKTIENYQSHPMLLTNGLMAPEAYTLDAAVVAWIRGESPAAVRRAAGKAYSRYQKIRLKAGVGLFYSQP